MTDPIRLSVVVPTQRRPGPLVRAVRSVFAQEGIDRAGLELVVADNDVAPSARATVEALRQGAPIPLVYVHEPRPGVATARNAAMAVARGGYVAFLDDDQEAGPRWLAELLAARERLSADVVFGPVRAALPPQVRAHRRYFESFFTHGGPAGEGLSDRAYGAGVCLAVRASLPDPSRPFPEACDRVGGEDDALFTRMLSRGARLAWNPQAWVWEHPEPARITLRYALRRAFSYGQGATNTPLLREPPDRRGAARSLAIGTAQALVLGAASVLLCLVRWPGRAFVYDKAVRGLGKVLHGPRFSLQFYGLRPDERAGGSARLAPAVAAPSVAAPPPVARVAAPVAARQG